MLAENVAVKGSLEKTLLRESLDTWPVKFTVTIVQCKLFVESNLQWRVHSEFSEKKKLFKRLQFEFNVLLGRNQPVWFIDEHSWNARPCCKLYNCSSFTRMLNPR